VGGSSFFAELKRRNVLRAGAFYAATAWLLVQVATQVFPFFHIPEWIVRWIIVAALIGFPFALVFAWFYEWTPHGLMRESDIATGRAIAARPGKAIDRWIIAALALAVVLLLTDRFVVHRNADVVATSEKSIAVLPLANESGDPAQDYFSDGLSEELISALGQVHDLKVIGRNSSFRFRGSEQEDSVAIGVKLGVSTLLEGTVRKLGDRVRIFASLVKATDGTQLWSQTYDREIKDVFAVQSEIATAVAGALKATLLGGAADSGLKPPSGNLDAYNALQQGRFYAERRNREDHFKAVDFYRKAIALDPDYALAYARLAMAEQWFDDWAVNTLDEREAARTSARANARKAVELNPRLPESQGALGVTQAWSDLDVRSAEATLKEAVALDPSNPETLYQLADVTGCLGRLDEAVAMMRKVLALDPLNASYYFYTGQYLLALGRLDEAEKEMKHAIDLQPTAFGYRVYLTMLYIRQGKTDAALATALAEPEGSINQRIALALAYASRGDTAKAQVKLDEMLRLDADVWPVNIAEYYAYRGDIDQTLSWLKRALNAHDPSVTSLWEDPIIFPALRNDARFAAFCKEVGLPPPSNAAP